MGNHEFQRYQHLYSHFKQIYGQKKLSQRLFKTAPPFHSIAIMLNGTGTLVYENLVIRLFPGDVFYIPQGSTYSSFWETDETSSNISYFSMHFSFEKPPENFYNTTYPMQKFIVDDLPFLIGKYDRLQENLLLPAENNFSSAALFFEILATVLPKMNMAANNQMNKKIEPALQYIRTNPNKPVSVKHLSALCFLSESRFFTLFRQQVGVSPIQYRNNLLLEQAAQYILIYPSKSIEEVADFFNFSSSVYFIRQFKKHIGMTPYQYKQKMLDQKL